MNVETTARLANVIGQLRTHHKHARKSTLIDGVFTIVNAVAVLLMTIYMTPGSGLISTIITWVMYRKYLHCRWREQQLLLAINHAQRMYVETPAKALEHSGELNIILMRLNLVQ